MPFLVGDVITGHALNSGASPLPLGSVLKLQEDVPKGARAYFVMPDCIISHRGARLNFGRTFPQDTIWRIVYIND